MLALKTSTALMIRARSLTGSHSSYPRRCPAYVSTDRQYNNDYDSNSWQQTGTAILKEVKSVGKRKSPVRAFMSGSFDISSLGDAFSQNRVIYASLVTALAGIVALLYAIWDAKRLTQKPKVLYQKTAFNEGVMTRMNALKTPYKPLPFMTNCHVETIFAAKFRSRIDISYSRESLHMGDGGIVTLDWRIPNPADQPLPEDAPVLILLPGLTGGSEDSYVRYCAVDAEAHGTRAVVFNSRGCGDGYVSTPQYHSALYIGDLQRVVEEVKNKYPSSLLFAAGWSLGANILVNYLGIVGSSTPLSAAAAMCNPFDLHLGSQKLDMGFNKIYSANLARGMSELMRRNRKIWNGVNPAFDIEKACNAKTVREWDDAITRVSFGTPLLTTVSRRLLPLASSCISSWLAATGVRAGLSLTLIPLAS